MMSQMSQMMAAQIAEMQSKMSQDLASQVASIKCDLAKQNSQPEPTSTQPAMTESQPT